jgi:hypothetical protein
MGPATVEHDAQWQWGATVTSVDGQVLMVKYKDGEKKIVVPPEIPIVAFVPGDKAELKPSAAIFIAAAMPQPDGTLQAPRVAVGRGNCSARVIVARQASVRHLRRSSMYLARSQRLWRVALRPGCVAAMHEDSAGTPDGGLTLNMPACPTMTRKGDERSAT